MDGEIVEVNPVISSDPTLANSDPYGAGWVVRLKASDWEGQRDQLVSGAVAVQAYAAFLEAEGIACD